MNNFPFFNRSTREYLGADIYQESQELADRKDDYLGFQEDLQPLTYRDRKRAQFLFSYGFKLAFPYLSGITLLALVIFLSFNINRVLEEGISFAAAAIGLISLIMCIGLVTLNELVKTRSLSDYFKARIKKERPGTSLLYQAIVTATISIVGSGLGLYLLVYQINDNSQALNQGAQIQQTATRSTWANDSLRIVQNYQSAINQKRESIKRYDPGKYRTLRDRLNNEAIALSDKMQSELKRARTARDLSSQQTQLQLSSDLLDNHRLAGGNAWIATFFIVLAELLNIICHRFVWVYKARSAREGIEFGALESSVDKTTYEIQLQRLGAYLQSQNINISSMEQMQIPRQGPAKSDPESGRIGFKTQHQMGRQDPSASENSDAPKTPDSPEKVVEKVIVHKHEIHGYEITCLHCGKTAIKQRKTAKFCSGKCRIAQYNKGVQQKRKRLNFEE